MCFGFADGFTVKIVGSCPRQVIYALRLSATDGRICGAVLWESEEEMKREENFVLRGNICYSVKSTELRCVRRGDLLVLDGKVGAVFPEGELPERFSSLPLTDYGEDILIPGMTDLHIHAPQYSFRGTGMDLELLDWLSTNTFPEEAKYRDFSYAERAYSDFVSDLRESVTTRALVFATIHVPATLLLMEKLDESGLITMVGKVNMDRNSPDFLRETTEESRRSTEEWLSESEGRFQRTFPILTPRFTPSCTDELMRELGTLKARRGLPVQSHLSENLSELAWVKELCPWAGCYGETYRRPGLLYGEGKAVMAHCVYSSEEELSLLAESGTYIAHCPQSNTNLSSGIAPIRRYLDRSLRVGLGTDVAGGANLSMLRALTDAIAVSKLRWRIMDETLRPLCFEEAFYLATKGGGSFFGNVGSFEEGYEADILVLSGRRESVREQGIRERLEQLVYLGGEGTRLRAKFVAGREIALGAV